MPFNSYLVGKFSTTYENKYFREFTALLDNKFSDSDGDHILVGNISCNGHQMDAIFIARGQITVIDFKDYSGELTFSENNPWRMKSSDGSLVFVQGGAQARNPFQQVKAYRFSLAETLKNNESEVFHGFRDNINWMHIGCIVLFHRNVSYEQSEIPMKATRFFHITDTSRIAELLSDLYSPKLELDDSEVNAVLDLLDVREENLFSRSLAEDGDEVSLPDTAGRNLAIIKKVAGSCENEGSSYLRGLSFYRTLISVERYNEPSVEMLFPFPFNEEVSNGSYPVDLTENDELHQIFLENQQERFPKNLLIGLDVNIGNQTITALRDIVSTTEISAKGTYQADLNDFELYKASFEKANLPEDIIEELSQAVGQKITLKEKLECIGGFLDLPQLCVSRISLGLSLESLFSAQLVSELKKLERLDEQTVAPLLKSFVLKGSFSVEEDQLTLHPFVEISRLNESQKKAIKLTFKQPLTVLTGPPGTGKSQVVVNIIANAVVSGHSVLFASKNNKAVDTVKERLDRITKEPYLLRFGSRDQITNSAIPEIKKQISRSTYRNMENDDSALETSIGELSESRIRLEYLHEQVALIPKFQSKLDTLNKELEKEKSKFSNWESRLNPDHKRFFYDKRETVGVDINDANLLIQKINRWNGGATSRVLFRIFNRSNLEQSLRAINDSLSEGINEYVTASSPWVSVQTNILISGLKNLEFLVELAIIEKQILKYTEAFFSIISTLENEKNNTFEKLNELEDSEGGNRTEILTLEQEIIKQSSEVLNLTIRKKLYNQNVVNTQQYMDYLPANNVWKDEDVASFTQIYEDFLESYSAICLTSLAVKNSSPVTPPLIDLLVIDEASQCDIASAIPLIASAKRVVVIGDPLQLRHITSVREYEQEYLLQELELTDLQLNYVNDSLYDHCFKLANISNFESIFLAEHYRCNPEIAEFSSRYFYEKRLGQTMSVQTNMNQFEFGDVGLNWINVVGLMEKSRNVNYAEVNKCIKLAKQLAIEYPKASIGIVTPFKDQYRTIFAKLDAEVRERIKVDTVHKYQGDEKDIIIFSLAVAANAAPRGIWFLNTHEYLINVAITRARSALYIVGDLDYCKNLRNGSNVSPLSQLARYAEGLDGVK